MLRNLAITTDFSEASREAFGAAGDLARKFESRLIVVHTTRSPPIFSPWQLPASEVKSASTTSEALCDLEALAKHATEFTGVRYEILLLEEAGAEKVCEEIEKRGAELLLIATHGQSGAQQFRLGSFTAKMLRFSRIPSLIFKSTRIPAGGSKHSFRPERILVPCDFSRRSMAVVESAKSWARAFDGSLRLLHVVESGLKCDDAVAPSPSVSVAEHYENQKVETSGKLREIVSKKLSDLRSETSVRFGDPGVEIANDAAESGTSLIVMSSQGLAIRDRLAGSSVAEQTIQRAPCPLLLMPLTL